MARCPFSCVSRKLAGNMTRGLVAVLAVVVAQFVKSVLIGWLANRRGARAIHVAAVGNTVILTSVVLAID